MVMLNNSSERSSGSIRPENKKQAEASSSDTTIVFLTPNRAIVFNLMAANKTTRLWTGKRKIPVRYMGVD